MSPDWQTRKIIFLSHLKYKPLNICAFITSTASSSTSWYCFSHKIQKDKSFQLTTGLCERKNSFLLCSKVLPNTHTPLVCTFTVLPHCQKWVDFFFFKATILLASFLLKLHLKFWFYWAWSTRRILPVTLEWISSFWEGKIESKHRQNDCHFHNTTCIHLWLRVFTDTIARRMNVSEVIQCSCLSK